MGQVRDSERGWGVSHAGRFMRLVYMYTLLYMSEFVGYFNRKSCSVRLQCDAKLCGRDEKRFCWRGFSVGCGRGGAGGGVVCRVIL